MNKRNYLLGSSQEMRYRVVNFNKAEFLEFLIEAKRATYAAKGDDASVAPLIDGSKQLEFRKGDFLYRDIYFGMSFFVGQETIYYNDLPVWSMSYAGGALDKFDVEFVRRIYAFLRKAMRLITSDNPYRGPKEFVDEEFIYIDSNKGEIGWFQGNEQIRRFDDKVYSLVYSGGFLR